MDTHDLRKGPTVMSPNCSNCKPEPLPKMRRRCKSETLDAHRINKRPPFFNSDKLTALGTNNDSQIDYQKNSNINEKSPKKYYQHNSPKADAAFANELFFNSNFTYKDKPKSSSASKTYENGLYNMDPKILCNGFDKNFSTNNSFKPHVIDKQAFINLHPKLFQEISPSKLDAKRKEETYRQFCHDVDTLRGKLNHLKNDTNQHMNLENYIKKSIIQANKYKENGEKANENSCFNCNVSNQTIKQNSIAADNVMHRTACRSDKLKDKSVNNYVQNQSPLKWQGEKSFNFHALAVFKGVHDSNMLLTSGADDDSPNQIQKTKTKRRVRAKSESDTVSQVQTKR